MKKDSIYRKKWSIGFWGGAIFAVVLAILFAEGVSFQNMKTGYVTCTVNGEELGAFHSEQEVQEHAKGEEHGQDLKAGGALEAWIL